MRVLFRLWVVMCRDRWLVGHNVQVVVGIGGGFSSVQVVVPLFDAPLSQFIYSEEYKDDKIITETISVL